VNVEGTDIDNRQSFVQQGQFATTEDNNANTGQPTADNSHGCDRLDRLDIKEISSSIQSKLNGTMWSVKRIDVMSFIQNLQHKEALVNENPWIQLDLGRNNSTLHNNSILD